MTSIKVDVNTTKSSIQAPVAPSVKNKNGSSSPTSSRKKSASLPSETVEYLKAWMMSPEHIAHPYPTEQEKAKIMSDTGIELKQLTNWFVNNRKRYWKPRVEARLSKQAQILVAPEQHQQPSPPPQQQQQPQTAPVTGAIPRSTATPSLPVKSKSVVSAVQTAAVPVVTPVRMSRTCSFASQDIQYQRSPSSGSLARDEQDQISVVGADNVSKFVPPSSTTSPTFISDGSASSSSSLSGSVSNADDEYFSVFTTDEITDGTVVRTETVAVHILRPNEGATPTLEDVSVGPSVPKDRILRTFDNCALTYRFSVEQMNDRKQVLSCREVEINRMKKHYLRLYLADVTTGKRQRGENDIESNISSPSQPRKKYRRISVELWRDACRFAPNVYDDSLPSLEEATRLFGYNKDSCVP